MSALHDQPSGGGGGGGGGGNGAGDEIQTPGGDGGTGQPNRARAPRSWDGEPIAQSATPSKSPRTVRNTIACAIGARTRWMATTSLLEIQIARRAKGRILSHSASSVRPSNGHPDQMM
jgi:hypothetical protein